MPARISRRETGHRCCPPFRAARPAAATAAAAFLLVAPLRDTREDLTATTLRSPTASYQLVRSTPLIEKFHEHRIFRHLASCRFSFLISRLSRFLRFRRKKGDGSTERTIQARFIHHRLHTYCETAPHLFPATTHIHTHSVAVAPYHFHSLVELPKRTRRPNTPRLVRHTSSSSHPAAASDTAPLVLARPRSSWRRVCQCDDSEPRARVPPLPLTEQPRERRGGGRFRLARRPAGACSNLRPLGPHERP